MNIRVSGLLFAAAQMWVAPAWAADTPTAPAADQATTPAQAEQTAAEQQPPAADPDADKVICKKLPPETGTHLGREKVCHTKREWDEMTAESKAELEKAQQKP